MRIFHRATKLSLVGPAYTDAAVEHVSQLKDLKLLTLWQTQISDQGLQRLGGRSPCAESSGISPKKRAVETPIGYARYGCPESCTFVCGPLDRLRSLRGICYAPILHAPLSCGRGNGGGSDELGRPCRGQNRSGTAACLDCGVSRSSAAGPNSGPGARSLADGRSHQGSRVSTGASKLLPIKSSPPRSNSWRTASACRGAKRPVRSLAAG